MVPASGYFERIADTHSVPPDEYLRIVDRNNRLCRRLGLQYLWSCMLLDGRIVFTTATSPSKDVANMDHAGFLEVHGDPGAFDVVFSSMEPDYSSFHNEWGHGRMVLVPYRDAANRKYCVGASVGLNEIHALLRRTLWNSLAVMAIVLCAGLLLTILVANSLARPITRLTGVAQSIAHGDMERSIEGKGGLEIRSLADSIAYMRDSIRKTISALRVEIHERQAAEKELEEHRGHLEDMVKQRTAELERSNNDLEQFAYVASHDLQEPLRKIVSFGDLLRKHDAAALSERGRDCVERMCSATVRMQTLIEDLLAYARVTSRAKPFERVDLGALARDVLSDIDALVHETGGSVDVGDLPTVEADALQMRQLLQNLLTNALKFHREEEPPRVRLRACSGTDAGHGEGGTTLAGFTVEDNGIGIDEEHRDRVFGIFQRLHGRGVYRGSGIGLAICRKIVDRHGGRISVGDAPGKGTAITVLLPLHHDPRKP
jgi:signal transduction histidine kinase